MDESAGLGADNQILDTDYGPGKAAIVLPAAD